MTVVESGTLQFCWSTPEDWWWQHYLHFSDLRWPMFHRFLYIYQQSGFWSKCTSSLLGYVQDQSFAFYMVNTQSTQFIEKYRFAPLPNTPFCFFPTTFWPLRKQIACRNFSNCSWSKYTSDFSKINTLKKNCEAGVMAEIFMKAGSLTENTIQSTTNP